MLAFFWLIQIDRLLCYRIDIIVWLKVSEKTFERGARLGVALQGLGQSQRKKRLRDGLVCRIASFVVERSIYFLLKLALVVPFPGLADFTSSFFLEPLQTALL